MALGVLLLGAAFLYTRMPKPQADRVEADLDVVGVHSKGSFAWIVRTQAGALLIDAGHDPEATAILEELRRQNLGPEQVHTILLTHGHGDHVGGATKFPNARILVGPGESKLVRGEEGAKSAAAPVLEKLHPKVPRPTQVDELQGSETLDLDGAKVRVIHVPGHTAGSVMFLYDDLLFTGDSLLGKGAEVIGAPGPLSDDPEQSQKSLRQLMALPFTRIADGHSGVHADARQKLARLLE